MNREIEKKSINSYHLYQYHQEKHRSHHEYHYYQEKYRHQEEELKQVLAA